MRLTGNDIRQNILRGSKLDMTWYTECSPSLQDEMTALIRSLDLLHISPFVEASRHEPTGNSYGLSYSGYDVTLDKILLPNYDIPNNASSSAYTVEECRSSYKYMWQENPVEEAILYPGMFCLGSIREFIYVPTYMDSQLMDKSSLARIGLHAQNTTIEPGWMGWLTVELVNQGHVPIALTHGMPIGQMIFTKLTGSAEPYSGKYQIQPPFPTRAL